MNERYVAALCLVMVVALGAVVWQQQTSIQDLNHEIVHLQNIIHNYDILAHNLDRLNESYAQLISDIDHFNAQINQNSTFQTPISKSQAIGIALVYGGWNVSLLEGMAVEASLRYMGFEQTANSYSFWVISEVATPPSSYSALQNGTITYRYIWYVIVHDEYLLSIPPPGTYFIDAATGEIVSGAFYYAVTTQVFDPPITYTFNNQTDGRLPSDFNPLWQG